MYRCSRSRFHGKETFTRLRRERLASYNIWSASRSKAAKKSKRDALKRHGTLNPHPDAVTDPLFETGDFFDRDDLLQLKYEMLRRVTVDKQSVTQSATAFGFSRPTYYQAEADFQRDGLFGLLPEKRGPREG